MNSEHTRVSKWQSSLLPQMVDRLARERPDAPYGLWPTAPASYEAGFRTITYAQLANIVNGLAGWLVKQLGLGDGRVLTYVGPNDVRLTAMVLASIKAGYVLFLTSPRNSPAAHCALFDALECRTLVTTDPAPPATQAVIDAVKPRLLAVPSLEELLAEEYPLVAYEKSFEEGRQDPLWVIHTSGSTGLPKPLVWTQESAVRHMESSSSPEVPDDVSSVDRLVAGKRILVTVPPFHGAGLYQYLLLAIPYGSVPIAPAAVGIVTAQGLVEALRHTPAEIAVLVPSVVAELAQNPELLDYCASHLELILYLGGDLPQALGDRVAAKIKLHCWWGASEVGIPHQLVPSGLGVTEWRYIRFHPSVGAVFDPITEDTYELVVRRNEALRQLCFSIRGQEHLEEYRTKDLFTRHPTIEDSWCWRARADDIIVFLNGEKTNPVSMEQDIVACNAELSGALVVGAQRFQAALLVEPAAAATTTGGLLSTSDQAALIERIWPSIQEANSIAPAHARIEKALVLVTSPDRPFIRAGKGTIQRAASVAQYQAEIDKLYADADIFVDDEDTDSMAGGLSLDVNNAEAVTRFVRETVSAVTGWTAADGDAASFFDRGMDSLQALQLTRALRRGLHRPDLGLSTIYNNATVSQLTQALSAQEDEYTDGDMMEPLLKTYSDLVHQIPKPETGRSSSQEIVPVDVILTGSTGTVGTFILRALLDRPRIRHIFCLNRGEDGGKAAQEARFQAAGLATEELDQRVTFLRTDLAKPLLGLDKAQYEQLRARAGLIIHNAWLVNFNLGLPAFRSQLTGLINLFALSASSVSAPHNDARFVFISSVGAVGGRSVEDAGPAPEEVLTAMDTPYPNGYARSKFLAEALCDAASRHLGYPMTIARIGQVAGAVQCAGTVWNPAEWLPSLVISSLLRLGCLPDRLGGQFAEIDWVPSDLLGGVVVDLALRDHASQPGEERQKQQQEEGAQVFNVRNPHTSTWASLLPVIVDTARAAAAASRSSSSSSSSPEVVPPSVWLARLRASDAEDVAGNGGDDGGGQVEANPAVKLMGFYSEGLWGQELEEDSPQKTTVKPMAIERALACSESLRAIPAVSPEWMQKWVGEWMSLHR